MRRTFAAQILETVDHKTRFRRPVAIVRLAAHARQAPFAADGLEQVTFLPRVHAVAGEPGIDSEKPAGAEGAVGLVEETLLVRHMLGAFDGDDAVEGVVLESDCSANPAA